MSLEILGQAEWKGALPHIFCIYVIIRPLPNLRHHPLPNIRHPTFLSFTHRDKCHFYAMVGISVIFNVMVRISVKLGNMHLELRRRAKHRQSDSQGTWNSSQDSGVWQNLPTMCCTPYQTLKNTLEVYSESLVDRLIVYIVMSHYYC